MSDERELIKKRFVELAKKSYNAGIFTFTDFLGLSEQSAFSEIAREISGIPYTAFGGAWGTERVMIRFGSPDELGYEVPFPIKTVKAAPVSEKFADKLTHRDLLGAILNLGIERRCVGDIAIKNNVAYIFAREDIATFIADNLTRARHTDLSVAITATLPDGELYRTEDKTVQTSGERLDAVIARVFSLSREDAQALFKKRLVFASGREIESTSYIPKIDEVVSVRGFGRFIYLGYSSLSKKGKLNINVKLYT